MARYVVLSARSYGGGLYLIILWCFSTLFQADKEQSIWHLNNIPKYRKFVYPRNTDIYFIYHQFNIKKFYVLPTQFICVLCGSENKQRLFPYTTLTF